MNDFAESDIAHALGRLEAKVSALEDRIARAEAGAEARMLAFEHKLGGIATTVAQSIGAVKLVHWVAGAMVAIGGFVMSGLFRSGK